MKTSLMDRLDILLDDFHFLIIDERIFSLRFLIHQIVVRMTSTVFLKTAAVLIG